MLTNSEVVNLSRVLVRDNKYVSAVRYVNQVIGKGGSNTYNMNGRDGVHEYTLSELDGSDIRYINVNEDVYDYPCNLAIAAVVEDVLYLIRRYEVSKGGTCTSNYDVIRLYPGTRISDSKDGISYDTDWYFEISPVMGNPLWETEYIRPDEPTGGEYTETVRGFDLLSDSLKNYIKRCEVLTDEIWEFERSDRDILYLFKGYRYEYFDVKERIGEIECALNQLRETGRITCWAPSKTGWSSHTSIFDDETEKNPNRAKEFEEILARGLPLYKELYELREGN